MHPHSSRAAIATTLMAIVLVAACSGVRSTAPPPAVDATGVTPPSMTTTPATPATTASTVAGASVVLRLDPTEALATRGGHWIEVAAGGDILGFVGGDSPTLDIVVAEPMRVDLAYRSHGGGVTDVVWEQSVSPDDQEVVIVQPWRRATGGSPAWDVVAWSRPADREEAEEAIDAARMTVLSPLTWFVTENGDLSGSIDRELVVLARDAAIDVWPAVVALDAEAIARMVADPVRRADVARRVSEEARVAGAGGVNLDIEGYRDEDAMAVSSFIEEVADAVHAWGGIVSYDLVPRSDRWDVTPEELEFWSTAPERRRIAAAVDYTVLMAYDQHNRHRPAGPVASPAWVEEMLTYQLRYSDPHSVILGIPAYGWIWDPDDLFAPRAVSLGFIESRDAERVTDDLFEMDRLVFEDGTFAWDEPAVQVDRASLAVEYGLAGVAVWRVGLDSPSVWEALP
jgi:hypothetical protein